ncbi:hypothetical protein Tco_0973095 [Tanacetum coccineum]
MNINGLHVKLYLLLMMTTTYTLYYHLMYGWWCLKRESQVLETYAIVGKDIKKRIDAKADVVYIILTGIDNDIYSIVDACPNAKETWKANERLKQGENINKQDVKTNLYWKFGKFTSKDGESLESYYSRSHAATQSKGKEIDKAPSPPSESNHKVFSDEEEKRRNRYDRNIGQYKNQRAVNVAENRDTVGNQVVQQTEIQCFIYKEFRHVAKECIKAKG